MRRDLILPAGAALLLALVALLLYAEMPDEAEQPENSDHLTLLHTIDAEVDSLLRVWNVDRSGEKKWTVRTPGGSPIRIERRILVPRDLVSLQFNRDLGISVDRFGGRVIGTERMKERVVVLHVIVGAMTVQTMSLELLPEKQS